MACSPVCRFLRNTEVDMMIRHSAIELDGREIEVLESTGNGAPVFVCHGNSSAAASVVSLLRSELATQLRFIAISFPGHGGSSRARDPDSEYNVEALGRTPARVIKRYQSPRYWLVGHSLGGHALIEALEALPGAMGLVLIAAPPVSPATMGQAFHADPSGGAIVQG